MMMRLCAYNYYIRLQRRVVRIIRSVRWRNKMGAAGWQETFHSLQ